MDLEVFINIRFRSF